MKTFQTTIYNIWKEFYWQTANLSLEAVSLLSYFQSISTPPPQGIFKAFYSEGQKKRRAILKNILYIACLDRNLN